MTGIFERIVQLKKEGGRGVLVTVIEKEGHGPAPVQARMLVLPGGAKMGTVGGGALEHAAQKTAQAVFEERKPLLKKYLMDPGGSLIDGEETGMLCGGKATLFFEYIGVGKFLYIFGAGHIGRSMVYHLRNLDYHVTMIDSREEVLREIQGVHRKVQGKYENIFEGEQIEPGSFVVIATHSHNLDYLVLKRVFESGWEPGYIGMVASRKKCAAMLHQLEDELGRKPNLDNLYSPVGLDIGGTNPDEIALSILCEIQALRYNKEGHKHMRSRP